MKRVTSKDGTSIAYDTYGSGPALIFITGAICHRLFSPVIKDAKIFAQNFTFYVYDRRGRGDSGDSPSYSVEKELDDIEALINVGGGSAYIYGHSSGAVLALEAALKFPDKVKKVALYEAPYAPNEAERTKNYAFCNELDQIIAHSHGKAIQHFLSNIGMPKPFIYLMPLMPGWKKMKTIAPTLAYDMVITRDEPPVERMASLKVPALIMYGAKSKYDFASTAQRLAAAIPECKLEIIAGQDHMVDPKALLPQFKNFFGAD